MNSTANNEIVVPDSASLSLTSDFTIAAWINPIDDGGSARNIVAKDANNAYRYRLNTNERQWTLLDDGSGGFQVINGSPATAVTNGAWNHIAVTTDFTASELKFYLNGSLVDTQAVTETGIADTAGSFLIGNFKAGNAESYRGLMDDLYIYDHALNAGAINALATNQLPLLDDNFDSGDNNDISADVAGRQDGSLAALSYFENENAAAGVSVSSNQIVIDPTTGVDSFSPQHNFIDQSIIDAGGFVIEFDADPVVGGGGTDNDWVSVNIGLSSTRAQTDAFHVNSTLTDLGILLRDNGGLTSFDNGGSILDTFDASPSDETYHVRVEVVTASFDAGEPATVHLFVDDIEQDLNGVATGLARTFNWDVSDENYILFGGISESHTIDNLQIYAITLVPEPSTFVLATIGLLSFGMTHRRRRRWAIQ